MKTYPVLKIEFTILINECDTEKSIDKVNELARKMADALVSMDNVALLAADVVVGVALEPGSDLDVH